MEQKYIPNGGQIERKSTPKTSGFSSLFFHRFRVVFGREKWSKIIPNRSPEALGSENVHFPKMLVLLQ
jgi:hypothetical protein